MKQRGVLTSSFLFLLCSLASVVSFAETPVADDDATAEVTEEASTPATPPPPRTEPTPFTSLQADLERQLADPLSEVIVIEQNDERFPAFYRDRETTEAKGALLIMADDTQHQRWPLVAEALRSQLPAYGWATLALPLPRPIEPAIPERTLPVLKLIKRQPADAPSEEAEAEAIEEPTPSTDEAPSAPNAATTSEPNESEEKPPQTSDRAEKILALTNSALDELFKREAQRVVIVGIGSGATWAAGIAEAIQGEKNIRLMLINPMASADISAPNLQAVIPKLKLTTIELYSATPPSNRLTPNTFDAKQRLIAAKRNELNNYHQIRLPKVTTTSQGEAWLVRYTRGVLEKHIVAAERDKKKVTRKADPAPTTELRPGSAAPPTKDDAI